MTSEPKNWLRFFQVFAARVVLEVLGGAGAIWGFSEVCTLRVPKTQELWRFNALFVGALFLCRYFLQMKDFIKEINGVPNTIDEKNSWKRFLQIFAARIVLEVFGGGGAIWGFSEVVGLRYDETTEFWRYIAIIVATIFFVRFVMQCSDYITELQKSLRSDEFLISTEPESITNEKSWKRFSQVFAARIVLEVFGGGGAIWGSSEALTLRNAVTREFWRYVAITSATTFFVRFLMQCSDFVAEMRENTTDDEETGDKIEKGTDESLTPLLHDKNVPVYLPPDKK